LPVPSRTIALSPHTAIESWAPTRAVGLNIEVLEWSAGQIRGNPTVTKLVVAIIGAATLPLAQLPNWFDALYHRRVCDAFVARRMVARFKCATWRRSRSLRLGL
jgi:hypothetical protein